MKVNLCLSLVLLLRPLLALEDITDLDMMNFFVAQKFEPREPPMKSHEKNKHGIYRSAPRRKDFGPVITVPPDNFDLAYQKLNESIFNEASKGKEAYKDPYPSLPTYAFNDDPTPLTDIDVENITVSFRNRTLSLSNSEDLSGYLPRTTTQETRLFPSIEPRTTERLNREIDKIRFNNKSFDEIDENTPPPPPPPDWAVRMMLSSNEVPPSDNDVTEEPFEVTDALESALSSTFDTLSTSTDWSLNEVSEVPTMKMYPWEMQRGDIDVHDLPDGQAPSVANPTFMPLSIRTPKFNSKPPENVLIPQELPTDVDLPKIYTIGPRLVLPQIPPWPETPRPIAPSAPPTLIMKNINQTRPTPPPRQRYEPNFSEGHIPNRLPTFVTDDDNFGLEPSRPPGITLQEFSAPPGIGLVSAPPSFNPDQITATITPPTSTTPYYTEVLIPKHASSELRGYSPELHPRVPSTTFRPQQLERFSKFKDQKNTKHGRNNNVLSKIYDPNRDLHSSYFSSVQDKSQMNLFKDEHSELKPFRGSLSGKKHYDESPFTFTTPTLTGAVVFRIPNPIKLSMSRAVKTMPVMVGMPKNYLHKRLGLTPQPSFHVPKQKDQKVKAWKSLGPLNWVPIGLGPPRRLGATKLVPVTTKTDGIELEVLQADDTKHELCKVDDVEDLYEDLKDSHRENIKKCFRRVNNCLLMDAVPLERRINYKEDQCINFCGHHPYCQSVAYSKAMSICDIFDKRNGTGAIRTVNYIGTTYYEALNSVALDCWRDGLNTLFYTRAPMPAVLVDSNDASGEAGKEETRRQETKSLSFREPVMIAPKDNCNSEQDVLLMKSVGFRIRHLGIVPLPQNSSETECVFACLVNLARGHIPYQCTSASFSSVSGCSIYKTGSNSKGNGHLIPANSFNHYEKACVSKPIVELCKGYPIIRQPQKILLGFTASTTRAETMVECLEICFFDFQRTRRCKSIMYFYEEREDNCVLNSESAIGQPQYLAEENDSIVDYASFENCVEEMKKEVRHSSLRSQQYRQERRKKPPQFVRGPFEFGGIEDSKRVTVMTTTTATLPPPSSPRRMVHLSVGGTKEILSTHHQIFMDNKVKRHHRPLLRTHYTDETLFRVLLLILFSGFNALDSDAVSGFDFTSYHDYHDFDWYITSVARRYPHISNLKTIGISREGRKMLGLKIGLPSNISKPAVWIDGGNHAREWPAFHVCIFFIDRLLSGYGKIPKFTEYINKLDIYIFPVINPDGFVFSRTSTKDSVRQWRKNMAPDNCTGYINFKREPMCCNGVDLNRNWDVGFRQDNYPFNNPCSDEFQGPLPFSEPETVAMRDFILSTEINGKVKAMVSLHTHGQLFILPYNFKRRTYPEDYEDLERVALRAAAAIASYRDTQYKVGTAADMLGPATGGAIDWIKMNTLIKYVYVLELPPELTTWFAFQMKPHWLVPTAKETWQGIEVIIRQVLREFPTV